MTIFRYTPTTPFGGQQIGPARTVAARSHKDSIGPISADEDVPDGDPDAVLAWVGHDGERAKAALVAEHSRGQSATRMALISALEGRITGHG